MDSLIIIAELGWHASELGACDATQHHIDSIRLHSHMDRLWARAYHLLDMIIIMINGKETRMLDINLTLDYCAVLDFIVIFLPIFSHFLCPDKSKSHTLMMMAIQFALQQ